jgi:hypothetical protein
LDIADTGVELGINKQDPLDCFEVLGASLLLVAVEEVQMRKGSPRVLFNFGLDVTIFEKFVPAAIVLQAQRLQ